MCYLLYIATPLTLSEVRSMVPPGLTADSLPTSERTLLKARHRPAQTVARLLHGACSCDLFLPRDLDGKADESHLRARYFKMGLSRARIIAALDVHRRALTLDAEPAGYWEQALVAFVAEHARNAGPTLYYRHFHPDGLAADPPPAGAPTTIPLATVRAQPASWLPERQLTIVAR